MSKKRGKKKELELLVVCVICNHHFHVPESKYLPDVDCPHCGASSPMVLPEK